MPDQIDVEDLVSSEVPFEKLIIFLIMKVSNAPSFDAYKKAVEDIEDVLEGYKDDKYNSDIKILKEQLELERMRIKRETPPTQMRKKSKKLNVEFEKVFIREKYKAICKLAKRKGMFPLESEVTYVE